MPVALAGPRTRRENQEIDAELLQTRGVAEFSALARAARQIKWRWIKRADDSGNLFYIDTFLHIETTFHETPPPADQGR
jgi:hypothetical protein